MMYSEWWKKPSDASRFKSVEDVLQCVCDVTRIAQYELSGLSRKRPIVDARHLANYFLRTECDYMSLADIGRITNRGHATVIHSINVHKSLIKTDLEFKQKSVLINLKLQQL